MQIVLGVLALLAIVAGACILTAIAIAFMRRGARHGAGSLGTALQELEGLFVESKRHVVHEIRAEDGEEESHAGDPPAK